MSIEKADWFGSRFLYILIFLLMSPALLLLSSDVKAHKVYKIIIVSCAKIHIVKNQKIWRDIENSNPDLLLFVGDMVYLDKKVRKMRSMESVFEEQWHEPNFRSLISKVPYFAIWDDHDAGTNNITPNALSEKLKQKFAPLYKEARFSFSKRVYNHGAIELYENLGISNIVTMSKSKKLSSNYTFSDVSTLDYSFDFGGAKFIMLDTITSRTENGKSGKILSADQFSFLKENINTHKGLNFVVSGASVHLSGKWGWRAGYRSDYLNLKKALRKNSVILSGDIHQNATVLPMQSLGAMELVSSGVSLSETKTGNYLLVTFSQQENQEWDVKYQHFGGRMKKQYAVSKGDVLLPN